MTLSRAGGASVEGAFESVGDQVVNLATDGPEDVGVACRANFLLRLASPDAEICFPRNNSWSTMHRPVVKGRERHATHRGLEECRAFAERFVAEGLHIEIEDIVVNGMP